MMDAWWLILLAVVIAWMAVKVVGLVLKVALWVALGGIAYFFFAQVFGWPLPALMG